MTPQDIVLLTVGFSTVSTLIVCLSMYKDYLTSKLLVNQTHQVIGQIGVKLHQQEVLLGKMVHALHETSQLLETVISRLNDDSPPIGGQMLFRTLDGKHVAGNLDEFLRKIKNTESQYLSDEEVEQLRKLFGQTDDPDDDSDTFNPGTGRF